MIYELTDTSKVKHLFEGWNETLIYSCLQKVMGKIYVTDPDSPVSAMAYVGCFAFYAGVPDKELVRHKPDGFVIMTPQNEKWGECIEKCFPDARKVSRYAIKKDTKFDKDLLHKLTERLPEGYELKDIDEDIYDMCLSDPVTRDFVSSFESKEKYLDIGRGVVVLRSGRIVAGASSFTRYKEGIEIEVDTAEEERRKGLATAASAALILRCLDEGLYPSWDAQNMNSVHLAEKLGYEYDHEYTAYEVSNRIMKRELGIARCGLACCLCSENVTCKGCKRDGFMELSWCKDAEWCEVRRCGIDKDLNGCYECAPAECRKGLFAEKIKPRAFAEFARRYGIEVLLDCLERNEQAGIVYHREGIMGDYDDFDDLEELIDFIRTGKRI